MSKYSKMVKTLRKNYTYSAQDLQAGFAIHPQTLRGWVKHGTYPLAAISYRPLLIFSEDLRQWLKERDAERKTQLKLNEMYCLSCKISTPPLAHTVAFIDKGITTQLAGYCPQCCRQMRKTTNSEKLANIRPMLKAVSLEDLHILGRTTFHQKTHMSASSKTCSHESSKVATPKDQLMLI